MLLQIFKKHYLSILIIIICFSVVGYYSLPIIWTNKSDLISIKGILSSVDVYSEKQNVRRTYGSQEKDFLICTFYLSGVDKKFQLSQAFDIYKPENKYIKLKRALNRADSITVLIHPMDKDEYTPKIMSVYADNTEVILFDDTQNESKSRFSIIAIIAVVMLSVILILNITKKTTVRSSNP